MPAGSVVTFQTIDLAKALGISAAKARKALVVDLGEKVKKGDLLARQKGLIKENLFYSPVNGILDSVSDKGLLKIKKEEPRKVEKKISLPGKVFKIKGCWGRGETVRGILNCFSEAVPPLSFQGDHHDQILALFGKIDRGLWHKAKSLGVKGIICGGLPDQEFEAETAKEKILVKGEEEDLGLPLVVCGGQGTIPASDWSLLMKNKGKTAVIRGREKLVIVSDEA